MKGGAAVTDNRNDIINDATGLVFGGSGDDTRWGAVVGAGLEFGFAPNWSAGVEYDHIFMGDQQRHVHRSRRWTVVAADRISGDADLVTVRVNYRWGGPVIARY